LFTTPKSPGSPFSRGWSEEPLLGGWRFGPARHEQRPLPSRRPSAAGPSHVRCRPDPPPYVPVRLSRSFAPRLAAAGLLLYHYAGLEGSRTGGGGWRQMEVEERSTIETSSLPRGGGCAARLLHHQTATQLLLFAAARARPDLRSSSSRRGATAVVATEEGRLRRPRSELVPRPRLADRSSQSPAPCPTGARSPLA
jgi:hypothetical protein